MERLVSTPIVSSELRLFSIQPNLTHSTAFCQLPFEVEAFHLKHCMDKVYTLLRKYSSETKKAGLSLTLPCSLIIK